MTYLRGGARKRRDAIEPAIVEALRAHGVQTWQIGGRGLPDLLCWYRGRPVVLEVKSGTTGRLSAVQAREQAPWPVVRSVEAALEAVCGHEPWSVGAC
jgi:hypothetical protein